jgi:hypothetical protein
MVASLFCADAPERFCDVVPAPDLLADLPAALPVPVRFVAVFVAVFLGINKNGFD